ncbi:exosortase D, VPLPA-CTERM-specific [Syntrophus gentianae]|uniref:Exosortase D, VPLPA-CTERM-specific n=1 Tax=Syntrophus gentianae TaxID=43775 RepID=A0A1H7X1X3_9BACT|nr:exosortase C-terminal domain/associated protein EpsI [Syntrophus gentianae]SEM27850.1 exosortase D, VPLPA-CTERM-specific [Syntrophus gentianae]
MVMNEKNLNNTALCVGILLVFFTCAYWVPLKSMVSTWWHNDDYSYGFFIPLISLYLFWDKRQLLKNLQFHSSWVVFPLLLLFVLISLYGILGSSGNISMPAVPVLIILFSAFCFGIQAFRQLILPLGFLVFMIPVPPVIENHLGVFLKSISSKIGGQIIELFNIPVHVSGNIIDLGFTQLQVVDACSGLRYLFPLIALGVLYAYFFEKIAWKKLVCVAATIPIAILVNALRIGATGILANFWGPSVAEGFFHGASAFVLFAVAFAMLFLIGLILRKLPPKVPEVVKANSMEKMEQASIPAGDGKSAFYVSLLILSVVGWLSWSTGAMPAVKIQGGIQSFPLSIGAWQGQMELVDPEIIEKSGAEEAFSGLYRNPESGDVSLYMGYRSSAFLANENYFHSPTVCLPSSGWIVKETTKHVIPDVPHFGQISVSKMVIENMGARQLVYFWFQTKDKATSDKNINRFHLAMHAIMRDNTYALFIRPITPIRQGESMADAEKRMDQFVREMVGALDKYLEKNIIRTSRQS